MNDRSIVLRYEGGESQRLDKYLVSALPDFSRTRLQTLIREGQVSVDGKVVLKCGAILEQGQEVQVLLFPSQPAGLMPESIPLDVVFENDDLIVVNKPAGMVVHPSAGHAAGTLVQAVLAHAPEIAGVGGVLRPGVVHRLDKDTSGLILVAKNDAAHRWLQDQFRLRRVEKEYLALVDGHPPTRSGRVDAPVGRNALHRQRMAVTSAQKGRQAVSEYHTLESFAQHTLLLVRPLTGRTHQIRVHMAFLGCPIVGDTLYGRRKSSLPITRHFLHATRLKIFLRGETAPQVFEVPLPADLAGILENLR